MELVIKQENKELLNAVQTLCKTEKRDFEQVAEGMGMTYQKLYHRLAGKMVEVKLLEEVVTAVQGKRKGRKVSLINYSEITIVSVGGLRISIYKSE